MRRSIYDISKEFDEIFELVEEADGVISEELQERLAINRNDFEEKMGQLGNISLAIEDEISIIDAQIKRLQAVKKRKSNTLIRIDEMMIKALSAYGKPHTTESGKITHKIELPTMKIATRVTDVVELIDIDACPPEFKKVDISAKIDFNDLTPELAEILTKLSGYKSTVLLDRVAALKFGKNSDNETTGFEVVESVTVKVK